MTEVFLMKKIILYFSLLPFFFACTSGYQKVLQAQSSENNITVGYHVGNIVYMKSKLKTEPKQSGLKGVDLDAAKEGAMNAKDGKDIYPGEVARDKLNQKFKAIPEMVHSELQKSFPDKIFQFQPVNKVMSSGKIKMMGPDFSQVTSKVFYFVQTYCLVQEENNSPSSPLEFRAELNCATSLDIYEKQADGGYKILYKRAIGRYKKKSDRPDSAPIITANINANKGYLSKNFGSDNEWLKNLKQNTSEKLATVIEKIKSAGAE